MLKKCVLRLCGLPLKGKGGCTNTSHDKNRLAFNGKRLLICTPAVSKATTPAYFSGPYIPVDVFEDPSILDRLCELQATVNVWRTFIEVTNEHLADVTTLCSQKPSALLVDTTRSPPPTGGTSSKNGSEAEVKTEPPTPAQGAPFEGSPMSGYDMVDDESRFGGSAVEESKMEVVGSGSVHRDLVGPTSTLHQDVLVEDENVSYFADAAAKIGITLDAADVYFNPFLHF